MICVRGLALCEKSEVDFTEMRPLHVGSKYLLVFMDTSQDGCDLAIHRETAQTVLKTLLQWLFLGSGCSVDWIRYGPAFTLSVAQVVSRALDVIGISTAPTPCRALDKFNT